MKGLRWVLKAMLVMVLAVVVGVGALLGYLSATEYRPQDVESVEVTPAARKENVRVGESLRVVTMNIGYGGLDRHQDFFMDGGQGVNPATKQEVETNMAGILSALALQKADIYLLQEVDTDSKRSFYINEVDYYQHGLSMNAAFAYNYVCDFVPIPWPPIGKVASGIATYTTLNVTEATRESLPVPFTWPMRVANLKRCLLIERVPVEGSEKELVVVNFHLEAYEDGEGKAAQTKQLMNVIAAEYRKGNYVIAGGDFNQIFEGADVYPLIHTEAWQPGRLYNSDLPKGFSFIYDQSSPTCRLLNAPYDGDRSKSQMYVIDGFIISDNLKVNHVETVDLNFQSSDHNPVLVQVTPL